MNDYMKVALNEALTGLKNGEGGPFGAVIVRNGEIIARAHNQVVQFNDPTCHAEMQAIRKATGKLGTFDLSDCEIYTSCEPCPMCFGAIHWAKFRKMYIGCLAEDAAEIGFDDKFIYDVIRGESTELQVETEYLNREECLYPFRLWAEMEEKTQY